VSSSRRPPVSRLAAVLGLAAACALFAGARADAANAVLARDGTLYEVFVTNYGKVIEGASGADSALPVVALRSTPPGQPPVVEIVGGTVTPLLKFSESIEFDDTTQTVFVVYTSLQVQGFFADVRAAMRRDGGWSNGGFLPNAGLYFSVNPKLLVTRQSYKDFDADGKTTVTKTRSILSVVWWEETALSQARYAALFIEDGSMKFDEVASYNLNELGGAGGPTDSRGLPTSSYMYPAVQRDPAGDGGVVVSFANLASRKQQVLRLGFPDDYTKPVTTDASASGRSANSRTTPIGRGGVEFQLPSGIDLPFTLPVGTLISPSLVPTFWWTRDGALSYVSGDAASQARAALTIPLRPDFQLDSALSAIRSMTEKQ
jgi:hypothetical protein